jgi:hypothetical protein
MEEACRYSDRPLAFLARYGFISSSEVETPHKDHPNINVADA